MRAKQQPRACDQAAASSAAARCALAALPVAAVAALRLRSRSGHGLRLARARYQPSRVTAGGGCAPSQPPAAAGSARGSSAGAAHRDAGSTRAVAGCVDARAACCTPSGHRTQLHSSSTQPGTRLRRSPPGCSCHATLRLRATGCSAAAWRCGRWLAVHGNLLRKRRRRRQASPRQLRPVLRHAVGKAPVYQQRGGGRRQVADAHERRLCARRIHPFVAAASLAQAGCGACAPRKPTSRRSVPARRC
jgi:hypothetical protein